MIDGLVMCFSGVVIASQARQCCVDYSRVVPPKKNENRTDTPGKKAWNTPELPA